MQEVIVPKNRLDFKGWDIYRNLSFREKAEMRKQIETNTIKYHKALTEEILPKLDGLTLTEEAKEGTWMKPRKATMPEKNRLLFIIANRQAKLQRQIDWLRSEQERNRKDLSDL